MYILRNLKLLFIILIISILLIAPTTYAVTQEDINNAKANISDVGEKIQEKQVSLDGVSAEKKSLIQEISQITLKITGYESTISSLGTEIANLQKSIEQTKKDIAEKEEIYQENYDKMVTRIVTTYENGNTTYLDVLLSCKSFTDLSSKWYYLSVITEADKAFLETIQKTKQEIENKKSQLENDKVTVETKKKNVEQTSNALKAAQQTKKEKATSLSEEEKEIEAEISKLQAEQDKMQEELNAIQRKYQKEIANLGGSGVFQKPISSGLITATMYYSSGRYHGALDYGVPVGTKVYAAEEGIILYARWSSSGFGNYVCIQHANGVRTYYAHGNGTFYVSEGQKVEKGQLIMLSGNTGNSSGPHLHFEVRVSPYNWNSWGDDSRRDPRTYL